MQRLETLTEHYAGLNNTDLAHTLSALQAECRTSAQQLQHAKNQVAHLQQQLHTNKQRIGTNSTKLR